MADAASAGPDAATLLAAAWAVADHAHAPYSGWHVGAAAVFAEDPAAIHRGANVENGSFGLTLCAERAAIVAGVSAGHRRLARTPLTCRDSLPLEAATLVIPGGTPPGCEPHSWSRSARRRGSTGIAITGCLRRTTGCEKPSRRPRSGMTVGGART